MRGVVVPREEAADFLQPVGVVLTVRSKLPRPSDQLLRFDSEYSGEVEDDGQVIYRSNPASTCDSHDSLRPTSPARAA